MKIEKNNILKLSDNKEYIVISKAKIQNKKYYYLVNINDNKDTKFCYQEGTDLIMIEDNNLINKIIPILYDNIK